MIRKANILRAKISMTSKFISANGLATSSKLGLCKACLNLNARNILTEYPVFISVSPDLPSQPELTMDIQTVYSG